MRFQQTLHENPCLEFYGPLTARSYEGLDHFDKSCLPHECVLVQEDLSDSIFGKASKREGWVHIDF